MDSQVDAVTRDPQVATDANRLSQYLSPNVFKMLIPVGPISSRCLMMLLTRSKSTESIQMPTFEEWVEQKKALEDEKKASDQKEAQIKEIKKQLEEALIVSQPKRVSTNND